MVPPAPCQLSSPRGEYVRYGYWCIGHFPIMQLVDDPWSIVERFLCRDK